MSTYDYIPHFGWWAFWCLTLQFDAEILGFLNNQFMIYLLSGIKHKVISLYWWLIPKCRKRSRDRRLWPLKRRGGQLRFGQFSWSRAEDPDWMLWVCLNMGDLPGFTLIYHLDRAIYIYIYIWDNDDSAVDLDRLAVSNRCSKVS